MKCYRVSPWEKQRFSLRHLPLVLPLATEDAGLFRRFGRIARLIS
jgi:hypothetical protein